MKNRWLLRFPPRPQARMRLLCLAGAGAAASMYRSWSQHLQPEVEVCAVQLPGRGARLREAPFTRMEPLADALTDVVRAESDRPMAIFGHSLGSLIGFEVASRLLSTGADTPLRLIAAAHRAPRLGSARLPYHRLPTPELIDVMGGLGGTPPDLLAMPDVMRLTLPAVRADFEIDYTYRYRERPPLPVPISVFGGIDDTTVSKAELEAWQEHTSTGFSLRLLPGDHFFHEGPGGPRMLARIRRELLQHV
ncbi:thioesterase II family protein [Streptantibioticus cattleyicolor]|uniref:Microcystin synthetase-associated thioesterase n=1 Tax=Streptantibioticus cattleyicolor (strain ATCC 35852 / DSM 46488 / JCM 4925 / NBRC 14057 / NRRL 8057) TaxID=1003195 RepID=F8JJQ2_STREN|nr:alpha/beta fold hydrolase [Streptantibioticus cattleyicolor]AEW99901.1 microcystin synthetase-associated thioesterase [Streptantibioticus cattleyicolor NRRL 8057 = DSM 46488]CCB71066.1 Microcystin synthetase-associated thioesterase [Streptantibioticus cattleyicolor NRRL 8057 = DSM 46488]